MQDRPVESAAEVSLPRAGVPGVRPLRTTGETRFGVALFECEPQLDVGLGSASFCQHFMSARHRFDSCGADSTIRFRTSLTAAPTRVT